MLPLHVLHKGMNLKMRLFFSVGLMVCAFVIFWKLFPPLTRCGLKVHHLYVGAGACSSKHLAYSAASCSNLRKGCESVMYWSSGFTALQACIDAAIIQVSLNK